VDPKQAPTTIDVPFEILYDGNREKLKGALKLRLLQRRR